MTVVYKVNACETVVAVVVAGAVVVVVGVCDACDDGYSCCNG